MASTVFKYELEGRETHLDLPLDAEVLHVGVQGVQAFLWILGDPVPPVRRSRKFIIITTGERFDPSGTKFLGTFIVPASALTSTFVGHVFEDHRG